MRVAWAWHISGKRPYRICVIGITIWSFLIVATSSLAPPGYPAQIISPRSRFCEAPQIEVTKNGAVLCENDRLVPEEFKREAYLLQTHLVIAKSLKRDYPIYTLQKHLSHTTKGYVHVCKIPKNEGLYIKYRENRNDPVSILHYFIKEKNSHTGKYKLIKDDFEKPVYIEEITEAEFGALKREIKVLFTPEGHCCKAMVEAIDSAETSIDAAIFNFDNEEIVQALERAKARGLKIRVHLHNNNKIEERLKAAKFEVRSKLRKSGLMHDKFVILDDEIVFSGSYNWTDKAESNRENVIVLPCAKPFMEEFKYIWEGEKDKKWPRRDTAPPECISALFSPRDRCNECIKKIISQAIEEKTNGIPGKIQIALYFFTDNEIAEKLFEAKEKGFDVEILLDKTQESRNDSVVKYLAGLQKKADSKRVKDPSPQEKGCLKIRYHRIEGVTMHNKFAVIGNTTLTGSYNWTKSAWQKNNENLIVLPYIVKEYSDEFKRLWSEPGYQFVIDEGKHLEPPSTGPPATSNSSSTDYLEYSGCDPPPVTKYRYSQQNPGPLSDGTKYPDVKRCPATSFFGGKYNKIILKEDLIAYRATNMGREGGSWFTRKAPYSELQTRIDSAVKRCWADPTTGRIEAFSFIDTYYKYRIPKGSVIYEGPTSYQGGCFIGGYDKMQIFIEGETLKTIETWDSRAQRWRSLSHL